MEIQCDCGARIPLPRRHAELGVQCPACGRWVGAPAATLQSPERSPQALEHAAALAEARADGEICPVCHKSVVGHAIRCRHCGKFLHASKRHLQGRTLRTSRLALLAIVFGALSFVPPLNLAAIGLSVVALLAIQRRPRELEGVWIARLGLFLGCAGTAYILYTLLLPQ